MLYWVNEEFLRPERFGTVFAFTVMQWFAYL